MKNGFKPIILRVNNGWGTESPDDLSMWTVGLETERSRSVRSIEPFVKL